MTEYVARHYFPLKGDLVTPGEIISDLPEDIIPRLLEKGAIEVIAPVSKAGKPEKKPAAVTAKTESAPETAEPEEDGEEAEVEIDALDGVVTEPKEEKPKARKGGRAKGGRA